MAGCGEQSIATIAQLDFNLLKTAIETQTDNICERLSDALGRFKLWAGNIGALHKGRSSLDARLGNSRIAQDTRTLLEELQESLEYLNEPTEDFGHDANERDLDGEVISDLLESINMTITMLFKTSALIRHNPERDPWKRILSLPPWHSGPMIDNVLQKCPKLESRQWLASRLGLANSRRRQFFQYREEHVDKLAKALEEDAAPSETVPTTFVENANIVLEPRDEPEDDARLDTTLATMFGAGVETKMTVPPPPDHDRHDVECTLCRNIITVKTRRAWKKHVYRDLRPYVCVFEECSFKVFDKRRDWQVHDMQEHRAAYACPICARQTAGRLKLSHHLKHDHNTQYSDRELQSLLLSATLTYPLLTASLCPFCDEWDRDLTRSLRVIPNGAPKFANDSPVVSQKQFCKHLGRHMEHLSLFALPRNYEEDKTEPRSSKTSSDTVASPEELDKVHLALERTQSQSDQSSVENYELEAADDAQSIQHVDDVWPRALDTAQKAEGKQFSASLAPIPGTSSYWSASEVERFPHLLLRYGTDWHSISREMGTKTPIMVKNYFGRLSNKDSEIKRIAEETNERERDLKAKLSKLKAKMKDYQSPANVSNRPAEEPSDQTNTVERLLGEPEVAPHSGEEVSQQAVARGYLNRILRTSQPTGTLYGKDTVDVEALTRLGIRFRQHSDYPDFVELPDDLTEAALQQAIGLTKFLRKERAR